MKFQLDISKNLGVVYGMTDMIDSNEIVNSYIDTPLELSSNGTSKKYL